MEVGLCYNAVISRCIARFLVYITIEHMECSGGKNQAYQLD